MSDFPEDVTVETFDGDTPSDERRRIRDEASVIFTNPDMLHLNILPNEEHWRHFLKSLKYVVVDGISHRPCTKWLIMTFYRTSCLQRDF